jgi:hypothetical protein
MSRFEFGRASSRATLEAPSRQPHIFILLHHNFPFGRAGPVVERRCRLHESRNLPKVGPCTTRIRLLEARKECPACGGARRARSGTCVRAHTGDERGGGDSMKSARISIMAEDLAQLFVPMVETDEKPEPNGGGQSNLNW